MAKLPVKGGVDRPIRPQKANPQPNRLAGVGKPSRKVGSPNVYPVPRSN